MLVARRCSRCRVPLRRRDCVREPDGLFGPELLCPVCGAVVESRPTVAAWLVAMALGVALAGWVSGCA
jgi:hypothetical protein